MKRPVLILGIEPRITIPIARSLYRYGVPVETASLSDTEPFLRSRSVRKSTRLPDPSNSSFPDSLTRLISSQQFDMLIPATDAALAAISAHDEHLRALLHVACPPPQVVQRVLNKSLTLEIAQKCGIRVPQSYRIRTLAELEAMSNSLQFPLVAKPYHKSKETDFKVRYFRDLDELRRALTSDEELGSRILLQEYCPGDGVGVEVLLHQGQAIATFQHRRLKEVPSTGGAAVVALAEQLDPDLVEQAVALLRAIEWEGVAMVEFRYQRAERRAALMEVNGRYWGTLSLPIQAGIDFPLYEWQLAHGETPVVPSSYAVGTRWRWTAGYVRRWHDLAKSSARKALRRPSVLRELLPSVTDLIGTRDAMFTATDPLPAISETLGTLRAALTSDMSAVLKRAHPNAAASNRQSTGIQVEKEAEQKVH
jgi:predicted ATP-grasp superfamily ATP-dependent carboligase